MRWIIAYDIQSDSARARIARRLERVGFRRQFSVFEGEAIPEEIGVLLAELTPMIDPETDSLSAWPTVDNGTARQIHAGRVPPPTRCEWKLL